MAFKLSKKLVLKILTSILEENNIPFHLFDFSSKHSTMGQVHKISNVIKKILDRKKVFSTPFLFYRKLFEV